MSEIGWLIELKGSAPSWAILNPHDYDEHWTEDSTKAIRFARRQDAQAYIDHIGWTEAFPSEHIWDDGERALASSTPAESAGDGVVDDEVELDRLTTIGMDAFEPLSSVLRYRKDRGQTWHSCDIMGMRNAVKAIAATIRARGQ